MKQTTTQLFLCLALLTIGFGLKAQNNAFYYIDGVDCKKVHFYDSIFSINPTQFSWNFGDGNSSTQAAPTHTYTSNGTYNVTFYAYDSVSTQSVSDTLSVVINCGPCTNFKANAWSYPDINNCKKINFTNNSSSGNYLWDFGDSNTSTTRSPIHTYTTDGNYNVKLRVSDSSCTDSTTFTVRVFCSTSGCDSFFARASYSVDTGDCKKILFSNYSSIASYYWDFGDGNTSIAANPIHTYATKGFYTVTLEVNDSFCNDSITFGVDASCAPINPCAGFKAIINLDIDSSKASVANLYNRSTGNVTGHYWDFGDGSTSTLAAPSHNYTTSGSITLTYIASDSINNCRDTAIITFSIDSNGNIRRGEILVTLNVIDQTQNATSIKMPSNSINNIKTYPNPMLTELNLWSAENTGIKIYNLQGQMIEKVELKKDAIKTIHTLNWSKGVYLVVSSNGTVQKIVKN